MESKILLLKILSLLVIIYCIYLDTICVDFEPKDCPNGYFRIGRMHSCQQWLDCTDFTDMTHIMLLSRGLVKIIHLYKWSDNYIIVSNVSQPQYADDFVHNIQMLRQLSPNPLIVQFLGSCNNDMLFTQYHPYGDASYLPTLLTHQLSQYNNILFKLNLCVNYVKILDFLHNSIIGTLVMCDSNSIDKTLSQYLLTNELTLVLNDLDALPQVIDGKGVKCGPRQLFGTFVAPEQLWPKDDEPFNDEQMLGYDHKTDIWKIPDVCEWFLGLDSNTSDSETIQSIDLISNQLTDIHNECKRIDPQTRPSAKRVLEVYQILIQQLVKQKL